MTDRRMALGALLMAAALVAGGCPHTCDVELVSREALFSEYNGNAEKLRTLWAKAYIKVELNHQGLFRTYHLPDGRLYFRRRGDDPLAPQNFMLRGREVSQEVFRLGTDGASGRYYYWVSVPGRIEAAAEGRLADLYRQTDEDVTPIDPTQLLNVLGVLGWPEDLGAQTQVVLKTPDKPCVYQMLVTSRRDAWGGWYLAREIWIDRHTKPYRPYRVWLYDRKGRVMMEAELDDYEPVATEDDPSTWPVIPTDIRVRWPNSGMIRSIRLRLSGQSVETADQPVASEAGFAVPLKDIQRIRAAAEAMRGETQ